jgi:hypothetical protein
MDFELWLTWSILGKNDKSKHLASFGSRQQCIKYLNYRKEECFFETGSMESAEEKWGLDNFVFEQTALINRESMLKHLPNIDLNSWSMDL